ncbi:MAG: enoyl-CoA hydratase/isomerase family protein [Bacteroidales bacterium]|nr:enoyl-CoA hydratase/isomerase family protein [Bacteroidales bacterium]
MDYRFLKVSGGPEGVVKLTISSPATLNALNSTILGELEDFVDSLGPVTTRILVITGEGKAFVAGADISEMAHLSEEEGFAFGKRGARVFKKIEDLPFPVIAAVNGFALGGGCELAMSCDIRIASAKARFGQPEVGLGIIPGFSGTYRLPKLVGQGIAKELIYTGKMIGADEALRIGLVNSVVAPEELDAAVNALVSAILKNAPIAVGFAKSCINENYDLDVDESIALENRYFAKCFATSDQKEGMVAFLNKRPAQFKNE